jgi:putative transposase
VKEIGNETCQATGRWLNKLTENGHQLFRHQERAIAKFRSAKSLEKFASIRLSLYNRFNQERHLYNRESFKLNHTAGLVQWRQLAA